MENENFELSFIVPAYNEEAGMANTLGALLEVLRAHPFPFEVVVVNDGSSDSTAEIASSFDQVTVISHPTNIGYGNALKTGIRKAKYDWIGMIDADGSYPVDEIPRLVEEARKGFDMVIAERSNIAEHDSPVKSFFRGLYKKSVAVFSGSASPDPNSGLRILRKQVVLEFLPFLCGTFSFTTGLTILASEKPFFVKYVPVTYLERDGKSKVRHFRDSLRTMQLIIQGVTYYNPIKFFILMVVALVCLVGFPAMCLALFRFLTLSGYYMIFGCTAAVLFGMGVLGDIVRVSSARQRQDLLDQHAQFGSGSKDD